MVSMDDDVDGSCSHGSGCRKAGVTPSSLPCLVMETPDEYACRARPYWTACGQEFQGDGECRQMACVDIRELTPLTVFLGPNGSGKSTVFAFLSECFRSGRRQGWDKRGRARELKTRGQTGPIVIETRYRERATAPRSPLIIHHLEIEE